MIKELLIEVSKIIPKTSSAFLVATTARAAHKGTLEDEEKVFIGFISEQADVMNNIPIPPEMYNKIIFVYYEKVGDYYQCKFKRNPALCLQFPVEMLDHPKKKRIGNTYWKVPTPIEDYLECTFNEDGTYKKVEV